MRQKKKGKGLELETSTGTETQLQMQRKTRGSYVLLVTLLRDDRLGLFKALGQQSQLSGNIGSIERRRVKDCEYVKPLVLANRLL